MRKSGKELLVCKKGVAFEMKILAHEAILFGGGDADEMNRW